MFQKAAITAYFVYGLVAITVYVFLPRYIKKFSRHFVQLRGLLLAACLLFFLSLFLPSPLIHGRNTQFCTHFFGGGVFTGLVWLFIIKNLKWKLSSFLELLSLYFLVSALGVANELFEFAVNGADLIKIPSFDTWWDLFANTLGALTFWVIYRLTQDKWGPDL